MPNSGHWLIQSVGLLQVHTFAVASSDADTTTSLSPWSLTAVTCSRLGEKVSLETMAEALGDVSKSLTHGLSSQWTWGSDVETFVRYSKCLDFRWFSHMHLHAPSWSVQPLSAPSFASGHCTEPPAVACDLP